MPENCCELAAALRHDQLLRALGIDFDRDGGIAARCGCVLSLRCTLATRGEHRYVLNDRAGELGL
jgi:hypothetical protein